MTPRYTVINCFGSERIAAIEKTMMPIPHVEKMAVVTVQMDWQVLVASLERG